MRQQLWKNAGTAQERVRAMAATSLNATMPVLIESFEVQTGATVDLAPEPPSYTL